MWRCYGATCISTRLIRCRTRLANSLVSDPYNLDGRRVFIRAKCDMCTLIRRKEPSNLLCRQHTRYCELKTTAVNIKILRIKIPIPLISQLSYNFTVILTTINAARYFRKNSDGPTRIAMILTSQSCENTCKFKDRNN